MALALLIASATLGTANLDDKKIGENENQKVGIFDQLGKNANIDLTFNDEMNNNKSIREFMQNKPTIFSMNYYNCPGICTTQFAAVAALIDLLDVSNDEYQVLTMSIEPTDTPTLAQKKKDTFYASFKKKKNLPQEQWKFLSGTQNNITAFSESIGYNYKKVINKQGGIDYIHPGTLIVVSPSGKITRYIYDLRYSSFDVKMALIEAKEERVGAIRVQALKYCFAYDPVSKKYVFQWEKVVGGLMLFIVVSFFLYLAITGRKEEKDN